MQSTPRVSVLMPTYKQETFVRRALESLLAQTFADWELILYDDASPDGTAQAVEPFLTDARIHYHRAERNRGVGAALNAATELARGEYIAYLPSDDIIYPEHLARLIACLDEDRELYLAYSGVRWGYSHYSATLQGDEAVGREVETLENPPLWSVKEGLTSGNLLAPVQVMHRRGLEGQVRWAERTEIVSDALEAMFWKALLAAGARFAYDGALTCEWVDHRAQHHKYIMKPRGGGLAVYRRYYQIPREEPLNWQPTYGPRVDERERYGRFMQPRDLPAPGGLKILMVGDLGFNVERVMAFEERGHKLYGLWIECPESWNLTGPFSYGNVDVIPHDRDWQVRVRAIQPDVIYGLLNWQSIPLIYEVFEAKLGIPFVFHFKEGPFICMEKGTWPELFRLKTESDGQIFISQENFEWFQLASGGKLREDRVLILDGDLPKADWFTDDWSPKLRDQDGEIHTVCAGRVIGMTPFQAIADAGIHVHLYGEHFHQMSPNFVREGLATGYLHLHPVVDQPNWVRELSQYDAGWFHVFDSCNGGDLRRAHWDDLNMPARISGYAAAGLPWILKDNRPSRVASQDTAAKYDFGVFYHDFAHLGEVLRDDARLAELNANMRAHRMEYAFDTHVDDLVAFFHRVIKGAG